MVTGEEMAAWVAARGLGELVACRGVGDGIENSTYFLILDRQGTQEEYVLTIAEKMGIRQVRNIAGTMARLAAAELQVPAPLADHLGRQVFTLRGKPALLAPRIQGIHPTLPSPDQCRQIGNFLGRMHHATQGSDRLYTSHRSLGWLERHARQLLPSLDAAASLLLREELARLRRVRRARLPIALIHGDLFRDNALFSGPRLAAVIDFFMAGAGYPLFDLAVAVNDWCTGGDGRLDKARNDAMLGGYRAVRPWEPREEALWMDLLCVAATRFWVSRLAERLQPQPLADGAFVTGKDPETFRAILQAHRE